MDNFIECWHKMPLHATKYLIPKYLARDLEDGSYQPTSKEMADFCITRVQEFIENAKHRLSCANDMGEHIWFVKRIEQLHIAIEMLEKVEND